MDGEEEHRYDSHDQPDRICEGDAATSRGVDLGPIEDDSLYRVRTCSSRVDHGVAPTN